LFSPEPARYSIPGTPGIEPDMSSSFVPPSYCWTSPSTTGIEVAEITMNAARSRTTTAAVYAELRALSLIFSIHPEQYFPADEAYISNVF